MAHLYPFISPLDSLVFDSSVETNKPSDMETEANLALWSNAQFTYDVQPGSGILEDKSESIISTTSSSSPTTTVTSISSPSSVTYENLANYLDYELPQQQQQQLQMQSLQSLSTPKTSNTPRNSHQQLLLPKIVPAMTLEEITKALLSAAPNAYGQSTLNTNTSNISSTEAQNNNNTVVPMDVSSSGNEKAPAEEDKRRRNTAASARFRIKKKMKEQTMEKTVREMTEKSSGLENRVKELELEIKWLRGLLIEKGTSASEPTVVKQEPSAKEKTNDSVVVTDMES